MTFTRMLVVAHCVVPCTNGSQVRRSTYCRCNRLPRPPSWPPGSSRYCPTWSASSGGDEDGVVGDAGGERRLPRPPRGRSLSQGLMTLGKERGVETKVNSEEKAKERGGSCSSQRCSSPIHPTNSFSKVEDTRWYQDLVFEVQALALLFALNVKTIFPSDWEWVAFCGIVLGISISQIHPMVLQVAL